MYLFSIQDIHIYMVIISNKRDFKKNVLKIGTRGSPLALAQALEVKNEILKHHKLDDESVEIISISTRGDRVLDRPLMEIGGKGLFTEEIEKKLFNNEIDIAVHSMKDMPTVFPNGLGINTFLKREDYRDSFISLNFKSIKELPLGAIVGSSSIRRKAQLLSIRSDLNVVEFRGNVQTRLKKLQDGKADATFLACAGLLRLGMKNLVNPIDPEVMMPAVAQGIIGIEQRLSDNEITNLLSPLNHQETMIQATVERSFLKVLDGSCRTPIGSISKIIGEKIFLSGQVIKPDGSEIVSGYWEGLAAKPNDLGEMAGYEIKAKIGDSFFKKENFSN